MGSMIDFKRPDGSTCKGYVAEAGKDKPGIVVIQEWWGLNDQIKGVADRFAAAGYNALAPDLYKGRVTQKPDEANHMMSGLDFVGASDQDIAGAVSHLAGMSRKVGVMGFCMGGALTIAAAARVSGIACGVPFYGVPPGQLADPAKIKDSHPGPFRQHRRLVHAAGRERLRKGDDRRRQQAGGLSLRRGTRLRQREEPGLQRILGQAGLGAHDGVPG